jgi:hypothetical protein
MKTRKPLILFLLCLLPITALGEKGQSVMFKSEENPITTPPDTLQQQSQGDECQALLRKIESLKGKPQRKHSAMEHYRQQCSSLSE